MRSESYIFIRSSENVKDKRSKTSVAHLTHLVLLIAIANTCACLKGDKTLFNEDGWLCKEFNSLGVFLLLSANIFTIKSI